MAMQEGSVISCTERRQHSEFPVSVGMQYKTAPASDHCVPGETVEGDSGQKEENTFVWFPY